MPERATWRPSDDWPLVEFVRNATRTQAVSVVVGKPTMTCVFGRCGCRGAREQWEWDAGRVSMLGARGRFGDEFRA
jgi:hypothetical protein